MIPIQNLYYMLAYAFRVLHERRYQGFVSEPFPNAGELLATILIREVSGQLKQGMGRDYLSRSEPLSAVRGKLDLSASLKDQTLLRRQLVCTYDDFSVNTCLNQVLKTTLCTLLRSDLSAPRKKEVRRLLLYFGEVDTQDPRTISWHFHYHRGNQRYQLLMFVCRLILNGLLQAAGEGSRQLDYCDEQSMSRLYEKFLLSYYRRHFPQLNARAAQIFWQLEDGMRDMLPVMRSDITLSHGNRVLIIDAKYYAHTTQVYYDIHTIHSHNLYQIFTYVKNKAAAHSTPESVSGLLLYARTDDAIQPNGTYQMSGNKISVRTLDLNAPFSDIALQLDGIAVEHFGATLAKFRIN